MPENNPDVIIKLLRALAGTPAAREAGHDVIFDEAISIIERSKLMAATIPCDVRLPPNTLLRKDLPMGVLIDAMRERLRYEEQYTRFEIGPN